MCLTHGIVAAWLLSRACRIVSFIFFVVSSRRVCSRSFCRSTCDLGLVYIPRNLRSKLKGTKLKPVVGWDHAQHTTARIEARPIVFRVTRDCVMLTLSSFVRVYFKCELYEQALTSAANFCPCLVFAALHAAPDARSNKPTRRRGRNNKRRPVHERR